ncbi:MFS transporter [Levilactobacillus zymae]|uniref:MFS transporter n=1 Tax=Levilactobacillus zymae TaxID=267363 RepID=A0ABQ0WZZ8_9LACO|nr:MFS transporter [Levilactobacillus zymae]KRL16314.1 Na+ xyloside symporter related transporter [Levilactobacillus zymae DSM 19395]QFR61908.1 MFS transporter [Levilactobacillus zymae]GEO72591.1 MFS transporter [Levilactobacillus zymae]
MKNWHLWKQRVSYGATDMAGNLIWQIVGLYLLFYYTTVLKISPAFVGTLFLVVRVIDAFDGLFFGYLIDHTHSKYGKSRPYFLWFGIPLGLLTMLLFFNPSFGGSKVFQLTWISIVYTLFSLVYSGANTPITAILPALTNDPDERTNLASARMVMTNIGTAVIGAISLPMVAKLGGGNSQLGWSIWAVIIGLVIMALFTVAFLNLHENDELPVEEAEAEGIQLQSHLSVKDSLKGAIKNKPWVILSICFILLQTFWVIRMQTAVYYLTYVYRRADLVGAFNGLIIVAVLGNLAVPLLSKFMKHRNVMIVSLTTFAIGEALMPMGVTFLFIGTVVATIAMGAAFSISFVMIADTVEYSRSEMHIDEPGILSSVPMVGAKLGMGLGGALAGWILSWGGFNADAKVQGAKAVTAISTSFIWLPVILALGIVVILQFYKLNEKEVASAVRAAAAKVEALKDQATDTTTPAASGDPTTPTVAATKDQAADTNAKDKAKDDLETED